MVHVNNYVTLCSKQLGRQRRSGLIHGASLQVWAMLVEMRVGCVAGFDLSVLNRYRWYPGLERVELDRRDARMFPALLALHARDSIEGDKHMANPCARAVKCSPVPASHLRINIEAQATGIRRLD